VETWLFLYKIWSHVDEMVILNLSSFFLYKNKQVHEVDQLQEDWLEASGSRYDMTCFSSVSPAPWQTR
jgi:hypothetical protein